MQKRKVFLVLLVVLVTMTAWAIPAKHGVWKMLTLSDGSEVRAQLVGDEHGHFWRTFEGVAYVKAAEADYYVAADAEMLVQKAKERRQRVNAKRTGRLLAPRKVGSTGTYLGKKKGLILLVDFKDQEFKEANNKALYERIANEEGFSEGNFKGSMNDYFKAQSRGLFELDFDVLGPLTMPKEMAYYGANDSEGNDMHPGEMVCEAVSQAKSQVSDWKQYDWDGDGEVDQVYVIYAGQGEADSGDENTIWPHAWMLSEAVENGDGTGPVTVASGLKVNQYACGPELNYLGSIDGIGTMCHEFSHCLGFPDYYDIDYSGGQGMGDWDLMCSGSYNDDGYQPAGYTSYERWVAGWMVPVVLESEDVKVEGLKSLQEDGGSYVIYNKRQRNEFFMLENRQLTGWDASLPGAGLLILHVDYDAQIWEENTPNDTPSRQRMTWIPADNNYQYETYEGEKYYTSAGMKTDPYPYKNNNAFNKDTKPAAKFYNKNSDGTYFMNSSVESIVQNADGTVSFSFVADYTGSGQGEDPYVKPSIEGAVFYESFDQCDDKGGNDGAWSGSVANGDFLTDNAGWAADKAFGASECAKFGTSKQKGECTTPAFPVNGTATLTFRAGAWDSTKDGTTLSLSVSGGTISTSSVTMKRGEFTDYTATITATGNVKVTFTASKRFFLDAVLVMGEETTVTVSDIADLLTKYLDGSNAEVKISDITKKIEELNK